MKEYYTKTYRPLLQEVVDKCEDEFEKKLLYIAAGALGLSFAFISDIVNVNEGCCLWMLLVGWFLLIVCICLNCFSHLWSKEYAQATIDDIDKESEKDVFNENIIRLNIDHRNRKTHLVNMLTIWLMIIGIVFIVIYAAVNICRPHYEEIIGGKEQIKYVMML